MPTPDRLSHGTLAYACCQCNAARGAALLPLDPTAGLRQHIEVSADGTIRGLTPTGQDFIRIRRLDRPNLVAFRRLIFDVLRVLGRKRGREAAELPRRYLSYPANLPDLAALKPPGGDARPAGIGQSAFARRERGELPEES